VKINKCFLNKSRRKEGMKKEMNETEIKGRE
jgi:hypothetical protein